MTYIHLKLSTPCGTEGCNNAILGDIAVISITSRFLASLLTSLNSELSIIFCTDKPYTIHTSNIMMLEKHTKRKPDLTSILQRQFFLMINRPVRMQFLAPHKIPLDKEFCAVPASTSSIKSKLFPILILDIDNTMKI